MHRTARLALIGAVAAVTTLSGCTEAGSPSTGSPSSGSASSAAPPSDSSRPSASTSPARTPTDPRAAMPVVTSPKVGAIGYGKASAKDRARFKAVDKASGGLLAASSVSTLTVDGKDVGAVAVYRTRPGVATSPVFQDQYVVQLLNAVAASKSQPQFVRTEGGVLGMTTGATPVAGWFDGDRVVLVYREGRTPTLTALAQGVRSTPPWS